MLAQEIGHPRQQLRVVLEVGIHDGEKVRRRREHAFDARPGEAATAKSRNAPNPIVLSGNRSHERGCPVRGIVVDKDDLPPQALECVVELIDDALDVVALLVGRDDNAYFRGA